MKARFTLLIFIFCLAAVHARADDSSAPKMVPRPVPGLGIPSVGDLQSMMQSQRQQQDEALALLNQANNPQATQPARRAAPPPQPFLPPAATKNATASTSNEPESARILVIHRHVKRPTAAEPTGAKEIKAMQPVAPAVHEARPGKIRIIPKADAASLLAPEIVPETESQPKPSTP